MAKNKRAAETATPPQDRDHAETYLVRIGEIQRQRNLNATVLAEAIARVKEEIETANAKLTAEEELLSRGLQLWAEANRHTLTDGGKTKTVRMGNGSVAWRLSPPSVRIRAPEMAMKFLIEHQREEFLRRKVEIDRAAMLANPDLAAETPGVIIASAGEEFVIETAGQKEMAA